ncbi:hypothetical protein AB0M34_15080 [Nocardia sp. NPDC050193]
MPATPSIGAADVADPRPRGYYLKSVFAGSIGTMIERFDWFVYTTFALSRRIPRPVTGRPVTRPAGPYGGPGASYLPPAVTSSADRLDTRIQQRTPPWPTSST